jgi:outer membrane protein OmpA-like peptidoglycan-associated protein
MTGRDVPYHWAFHWAFPIAPLSRSVSGGTRGAPLLDGTVDGVTQGSLSETNHARRAERGGIKVMSKNLVFPLVAVFSMGIAASFAGCSCGAEAKLGNTEPKVAEAPPPPAPEPPEPPEVKEKAPPIKAVGKAKIVGDEIQVPGKVHFEFNKSAVKEDAETLEILNTLVEVLKENPNITKLRVEGYTDSKGKSDYNHKLSKARAEAVAKWLAAHGVDENRIAVHGYGEEHPVAENDTDENREKNRRTEFKIWELDGKPTGVAKAYAESGTPDAAAAGTAGKK